MSGFNVASIPSSRLGVPYAMKEIESAYSPVTQRQVPPPVPPMPIMADTSQYTYYQVTPTPVKVRLFNGAFGSLMIGAAAGLNYYTRTAPDYNSDHKVVNVLGAIVAPIIVAALGGVVLKSAIAGKSYKQFNPAENPEISLNDPSIRRVKANPTNYGVAIGSVALGAIALGSAVKVFQSNMGGKASFVPLGLTFLGAGSAGSILGVIGMDAGGIK